MKSTFKRLIRFKDSAGEVLYGEAPAGDTLVGQQVEIYAGEAPWDLKHIDRVAKIAEVLCPLADTPLIYGIGLNYKGHIAEANLPTPEYPAVFTKLSSALNSPYSEVSINGECQLMDYEGELAIFIGKDCKNARSDADAIDCILGYAVRNDVSSRYWQIPERSGGQHSYAKSFDGFAPIGPVLISSSEISPENLDLITRVNSEERQNTKVDNLLFDVAAIIKHLSRGTTLRAGTVIMTGTPSGVAAFMNPQPWLQDSDIIKVAISNIGTIRNRYVFEE
ncbi:hypothetical protein ACJZ2D_010329 [Fusarium nematophilum]